MIGVTITNVQANGVTTTFATIIDIRWKPGVSADIQVGYFLDSASYVAKLCPVHTEYAAIDIAAIVPIGNIPAQLLSQLIADGGLLAGGTPI